MCISEFKKVISIKGKTALLEDGREVKLGPLKDIFPGDYLEVYANLALAKIDPRDVQLVSEERKQVRV